MLFPLCRLTPSLVGPLWPLVKIQDRYSCMIWKSAALDDHRSPCPIFSCFFFSSSSPLRVAKPVVIINKQKNLQPGRIESMMKAKIRDERDKKKTKRSISTEIQHHHTGPRKDVNIPKTRKRETESSSALTNRSPASKMRSLSPPETQSKSSRFRSKSNLSRIEKKKQQQQQKKAKPIEALLETIDRPIEYDPRLDPISQIVETSPTEKLSKIIAHAGICSRREAEKYILDCRVKVDGKVVDNVATRVFPNQVEIAVDDKVIAIDMAKKPRIWLHHKMVRILVSHAEDPEGRVTLFPVLKDMDLPHLISIGRLDYMSEGLLVLTNNGDLARHLELPSSSYERIYQVHVHGNLSKEMIRQLQVGGLKIDGETFEPLEISSINKINRRNNYSVLQVVLREGKNRELRKLFGHFGVAVSRLIRTQYGPYTLDKVPPGSTVEVSLKEPLVSWWTQFSSRVKQAQMAYTKKKTLVDGVLGRQKSKSATTTTTPTPPPPTPPIKAGGNHQQKSGSMPVAKKTG